MSSILLALGFGSGPALAQWNLGAFERSVADIDRDIREGRGRFVIDARDCDTGAEPVAARPVCLLLFLHQKDFDGGSPFAPDLPLSVQCSVGGERGEASAPYFHGSDAVMIRFERLEGAELDVGCQIRSDSWRWEATSRIRLQPSEASWDYGVRILSIEDPVKIENCFRCRTPDMDRGWEVEIRLQNASRYPIGSTDVACALDQDPTLPTHYRYPFYWPQPWRSVIPGAIWSRPLRFGPETPEGEHTVRCAARLNWPSVGAPLDTWSRRVVFARTPAEPR